MLSIFAQNHVLVLLVDLPTIPVHKTKIDDYAKLTTNTTNNIASNVRVVEQLLTESTTKIEKIASIQTDRKAIELKDTVLRPLVLLFSLLPYLSLLDQVQLIDDLVNLRPFLWLHVPTFLKQRPHHVRLRRIFSKIGVICLFEGMAINDLVSNSVIAFDVVIRLHPSNQLQEIY